MTFQVNGPLAHGDLRLTQQDIAQNNPDHSGKIALVKVYVSDQVTAKPAPAPKSFDALLEAKQELILPSPARVDALRIDDRYLGLEPGTLNY